ncbi:hypothetical protein ACWDR7_09445 [Microbacterium sp. NPDC003461]
MVSDARLRASLEHHLLPGETVLASTRGVLQNTGGFLAPSVWFAATNDRLLFANTRSHWSYEYDEWGVTLLVDGRYQEGTTGRDVYESQEVH